jgi:erythrocyte band 7 integral membrane protein
MYYKVKDATSAVANVDDYSGSARLLAATTLRNVLGTRNLGDILSERESIAQEMQVKKKKHLILFVTAQI